ncbi:MAG: hypothetical protein Q4Q17_01225 [Tissierellia bacterium]|nr:hypothetical protein [Tissierellia bacterium]
MKRYYHAPTKEDFKSLMERLEKEGFTWKSGGPPTEGVYWHQFKEMTVIEVNDSKKLDYCYRDWFLKEGVPESAIITYIDSTGTYWKRIEKYYHVKTKPNYDSLMKKMEANGCTWYNGNLPTDVDIWKHRGRDTVITLNNSGDLGYCGKYWLIEEGLALEEEIKIYDDSKYYHVENKKQYDSLMGKLEKQYCQWITGELPTMRDRWSA